MSNDGFRRAMFRPRSRRRAFLPLVCAFLANGFMADDDPARGQVVITIAGKKHWHWRALADFLNSFRISRCAAPSIRTASFSTPWFKAKEIEPPRVMITDKLKSYGAAREDMGVHMEHRQHKGLNNRAENFHQPMRRRERSMKRFKSPRQVQKFLSIHDQVANLLHIIHREKMSAPDRRVFHDQAFAAWAGITSAQLPV